MSQPTTPRRRPAPRLAIIGLAGAALAMIIWAAVTYWTDLSVVGEDVTDALWVLPFTIGLHLFQLFLSTIAWRGLIPLLPTRAPMFRLRVIREGIDSLLPVAQMGGEVVGARLLTRHSVASAVAGASVVVDVTIETLSQLVFILFGLLCLLLQSGDRPLAEWIGTAALVGLGGGLLLLAQRLGLLRLLEFLVARIGAHFPALAAMSLSGLHGAAEEIYSRRGAIMRGFGLHLFAWFLGTLETWLVLSALGAPASLAQALVIESLGIAARSVGFAIPGALTVQEGGFALAAAAVGLSHEAGLALSLVKRARELAVGVVGVLLARQAGAWRARPAESSRQGAF